MTVIFFTEQAQLLLARQCTKLFTCYLLGGATKRGQDQHGGTK